MTVPVLKAANPPATDDVQNEFQKQMLSVVPRLRAFALSLSAKSDYADDLVQETLMKAWNHQNDFQPGTNMKAWLFTILRNEYFSQLRKKKRKREVEDVDGELVNQLSSPANQEAHLDVADLRVAMQQLPDDQREAIILVGASGLSYQEVSEITQFAVGTVKSRVNRACVRLASHLDIDMSQTGKNVVGDMSDTY